MYYTCSHIFPLIMFITVFENLKLTRHCAKSLRYVCQNCPYLWGGHHYYHYHSHFTDRSLKLREVKEPVQGPRAIEWRNRNSEPTERVWLWSPCSLALGVTWLLLLSLDLFMFIRFDVIKSIKLFLYTLFFCFLAENVLSYFKISRSRSPIFSHSYT